MLALSELTLSLERPLFEGLSCCLEEGNLVVLQGASGVGKSTLLRCMVGLESRARAKISWLGNPLRAQDMPAFRAQAIYLPQSPPRWPGSSEESLKLAFQFDSQQGNYDDRKAKLLCEKLQLDSDLLARPLIALSGGEAKRLAFVRALLLNPKVLLLDEPASGLDADSTAAMASVLQNWLEEGKRAAICSTHQPSWLGSIGFHSWTLKSGGSLDVASPE